MEHFRRKIQAAHPLTWYRPGRVVQGRMLAGGAGARYTLTEPPGKNFGAGFRPRLSPGKMLRMGVFESKYLNDCTKEFPREWYEGILARMQAVGGAQFAKGRPVADPRMNAFGIKSRLSLGEWRRRGWIPITAGDKDERGWFQWYCRYWLGRRMPAVDSVQIARWRAFTRHRGQILASYRRLGRNKPKTRAEKKKHRPKQRQALLQWAYDPFV